MSEDWREILLNFKRDGRCANHLNSGSVRCGFCRPEPLPELVVLPAAELDARVAQARREALEEAAQTVEREGVLAEQREEWFEPALVARRLRALARRPEETP